MKKMFTFELMLPFSPYLFNLRLIVSRLDAVEYAMRKGMGIPAKYFFKVAKRPPSVLPNSKGTNSKRIQQE